MIDLLTLTAIPQPLADVFYYDGPNNFLSNVEGEVVYLALREQPSHEEPDQPVGWFIGFITDQQVFDGLTGKLSMCDMVRQICKHRIQWFKDKSVKVFACVPEDYTPDYLPHEQGRYEFTQEEAMEMLLDVKAQRHYVWKPR